MCWNTELERNGFHQMRAVRQKLDRKVDDSILPSGITTKYLDDFIKNMASTDKTMTIKTTSSTEKCVDGMIIHKLSQYKVALSLRDPITADMPQRFEILRASVCGSSEEPGVWVQSKWKTWKKMSQELMKVVLENRIKYPDDQLTKLFEWLKKYSLTSSLL
eukprot:TRINITY_DN565_c0_g1_i1.p1 TRINITY_DN565_c0_g1~~TRINITY_DN565_c0_g1_i1.p1  ORF type:complete len:161 (-),score=26.91 TRINITY_DN565_c0_g1_i1:156-638(-)